MKCPACHYADSKVTDSRLVNQGYAIRRRRECEHCSFRFSTYEEVEILNLTVVKRDGSREPYSREKLEAGLKRAFEKLPFTGEQFRRLVSGIERDIQLKGKTEITSRAIGEIIMRWLKRTDEVAYIRFASVYRSFKDVDSFKAELNLLVKPPRQRPQRNAR
ncbi:MAG: transcriptional repressor NrdR [Candidatus Kerfeldbacteria bacterium]|nr:transcriptional repressor NrdR [Candidatus Kerfeldbacteria bacterium]